MALLALAWLPQASAVIIAEHTHVNGEQAGNNHYSNNGWIGAENFSVSGNVLVTEISHVAHHARGSGQPAAIDWWIYGDNGGTPGAIIAPAMDAAYTRLGFARRRRA